MTKASPSLLLLFLFLLPCCPSVRVVTRKALHARTDAHVQTKNAEELAPAEEAKESESAPKASEEEPTAAIKNAEDIAPAEEAAEEAKESESAPRASEEEPTAAVAAAPAAAGAEETAEFEAPKKPTAWQVHHISWCLEHVQELRTFGENRKSPWHETWTGTFATTSDLLKSLRGDLQHFGDDDRKQSWNERWAGILTAIDRLIDTFSDRRKRQAQRHIGIKLRREIAFVSRRLMKELKSGISNDVKELQMQLDALGSSIMLQSGSWKTFAELGFKLATLQELMSQGSRQHQWYGENIKERQELQTLQEVDAAKFKKLKDRLSEGISYPIKVSLQNVLEDFQAQK